MTIETELKFHLARPAALRRRLLALGFTVHRPRTREQNWLFGNTHATLLRLRHSGNRWLLTAKGPRLPGPLKRRREIEIESTDGPALRRLLNLALGEPLAYSRFRTIFTRRGETGEIAWDETPFGTYLEIEGTAAWVRHTSAALGLRVEAAEPRSYPEIYANMRSRGSGVPGAASPECMKSGMPGTAGQGPAPKIRRQKARKR